MNVRPSMVPLLVTLAGAPACAGTGEAPAGDTALPLEGAGPLSGARADHRFCGWLYASPDDPASAEQAYDTFAAHADEFDAVHPTWWRVESPTSFTHHARDTDTPSWGFHDPRVLAHTTKGGGRTKLVPMIAASNLPGYLYVHRMIYDAELRREHVRALVDLAVENEYDGVDLDYEHFDPAHLQDEMGPGHTGATERAAFAEFFAEAASALHAAGKTISLAVPVIVDDDEPVYDYDALSRDADAVHVMNYDYHYEGDTHAGPLAPLGWVEDNLDLIQGIDGGRRAGKFLMGLANYGVVGPEVPPGGYDAARLCEPRSRCLELFQGPYEATTAHMSHCPTTAKRRYPAGRVPNVALAGGERLFFEDLDSLDEKIAAGALRGLGGVTYWTIGGEPGGEAFFAWVRARYPRAGR
jgi:spore germination protein YaaH